MARVSGGEQGKAIAERTSLTPSTISRWLNDTSGMPNPRQVLTFARAYGENPIRALIAAGYVTEEELGIEEPRAVALSRFTDLELAGEIARRVAAGPSPILEAPMDENHPAMRQ